MANLTLTAYRTRQIIKATLIFTAVFFTLKTSFSLAIAYWRQHHPPPPPPPNVAFGKLPPLFSFKKQGERPTNFSLETVEGGLPSLPSQAKVYFVLPQESRFLALEKTNQLARRLGFVQEPEKLKENLYRYHNPVTNTTLTINPLTWSFKLSYPYLTDQTLTTFYLPPSNQEIINSAWTMLTKINREHPDITQDKVEVHYWKLTPTKLVPAPSLSEANLAQVNFFREKIEGQYPIYPPNLNQPNIWALVSGAPSENKKIVQFQYTYFPIDKEKFATYPLKPIEQAWEELKKGEYHLAKISPQKKSTPVVIRKIYLAYLDPSQPTNFLQPIYVFEGDNDFVAFVAAVSVEWTE